MTIVRLLAAASIMALASACEVNVNDGAQNQAQETAQQNQSAAAASADPQAQQRARARADASKGLEQLRFEVDISDRKVRAFNGNQRIAEEPVAVGSEKWPTPLGDFAFNRVDLNPEWIPPKEEEWAEDATKKAPGDPQNPMGRARLVYRMPNTIHGTDDLNSLGKAVSHGSIRAANPVALKFAQLLLKAGGAYEGDQWFNRMVQNRTKEFQIPLERDIPIKVQE